MPNYRQDPFHRSSIPLPVHCSLLHYNANDIISLEIKNPIQLGKRAKDKKYIYDIYLALNNHKKVHLELQVVHQDFWTERSLCYLCRDFGNLNAGDSYDQVQPLTQIDILDFDLYKNTKEFFSTYHFANDKTGRIFSSKLTLHVLQLGKEEYATEEDKAYHIDYWSKLFKATTWEELRMLAQQNPELQSTVETIFRISADDDTRAEIFAREEELRVALTLDNELKRRAEKLEEQRSTIDEQRSTIDEQQSQLAKQAAYIAELEAKLQPSAK